MKFLHNPDKLIELIYSMQDFVLQIPLAAFTFETKEVFLLIFSLHNPRLSEPIYLPFSSLEFSTV